MKTIGLITTALILQTNAHAAFNRLWVGHKKQGVDTVTFMNGLNKVFFEQTINVGKGRGLLAYQPYITKMNNDLPDELALVTYKDEVSYRAIRSTPEGEAYSRAHWDYFEKATSKSAVPIPYQGMLEKDVAYEIKPVFVDWQQAESYVVIYQAPQDLKQLAKEFTQMKKDKSVNNSIFMVKGDLLIEYRSLKEGVKFRKLPLKVLEQAKLLNSPLQGAPTVGFGEGVNFRF